KGEFASFDKFIEHNWNLPTIGADDALSSIDNLMDYFNFTQKLQPPLIEGQIPYSTALLVPTGQSDPSDVAQIIGSLTPTNGDTSTQFTYSIIYTLTTPPSVATVNIDGTAYPMTAKGAVTGGTLYQYKASGLSVGKHSFTFTFSDSSQPDGTV